MTKVLSTKILSPRLRKIIESHGIKYSEYNAIDIEFRKFSIDLDFDYYIFTSQNAVRAFLRVYDDLPLPEKRKEALSKECFCVGLKTTALVIENGLKVLKTAKNSKELAEFVLKRYKNASFSFICGDRRRNELPDILDENSIRFKEIVAYYTLDNPKKIDENFDGVLFYSPSGVQSYTSSNDLSNSTAFCIGESTSREASIHTNKIKLATQQSIESVLETVVDHYQNQ